VKLKIVNIREAPARGRQTAATPPRRMRANRARRSILTVLQVTVIIVIPGILLVMLQRPRFESTAVVQLMPRPDTASSTLATEIQIGLREDGGEALLALLTSADVWQDACAELTPSVRQQGFNAQSPPPWAVRVRQDAGRETVRVTVRAYTPTAATALANGIAELAIQRDTARRQQLIHSTRQDIAANLQDVRQAVDQADVQWSLIFRNPAVHIDPRLSALTVGLARLDVSVRDLRAKCDIAREAQQALLQQWPGTRPPMNAAEMMQDVHAQQLLADLRTRDAEWAILLGRSGPNPGVVQRDTDRIIALEMRLREVARTRAQAAAATPAERAALNALATDAALITALALRVDALTAELQRNERELARLPQAQGEYYRQLRKVAVLQSTGILLQKKDAALMAIAQEMTPAARILTDARPSKKQVSPDPLKAFGVLLVSGALFGCLVSFVIRRPAPYVVPDEPPCADTGLQPAAGQTNTASLDLADLLQAQAQDTPPAPATETERPPESFSG